MCGIFGAARVSGMYSEEDRLQFQGLTDLVRYRGPDDSGKQTWKVREGRLVTQGAFDVFLGSRRLSIIDLSPLGHMPMTDGRGRWIVFNGEIFNYLELRRELESEAGCEFRSNTDTEVILAIYDRYGEQGFDRLNGMWAFAILDLPARKLILSRDRFSIKPLYLLRRGQEFLFASELKQLLPLLPKVELNEPVMMAFLSQALLDHSDGTFFRGIVRVRSCTSLTICLNTGKVQEHTYWSLPAPVSMSTEEAMEAFRAVLTDSVRIRLRSDVKVGVLLSGGLDSSAIAVLANKFAQLETYSVVADDPRYDERRFIDMVVKGGIRNTKVVFRHGQVMEDLERCCTIAMSRLVDFQHSHSSGYSRPLRKKAMPPYCSVGRAEMKSSLGISNSSSST